MFQMARHASNCFYMLLVCNAITCNLTAAAVVPPKRITEQNKNQMHIRLLRAIEKNDVAAVKKLLVRGADPNRPDFARLTPLMVALALGNGKPVSLPIVQALLDKGANPNALDDDGASVLEYAISSSSASVVQALIRKGANVNARPKRPFSPLSVAVDQNDFAIVKMLCDAGAITRSKVDRHDRHLLSVAAKNNNIEIMEMLISKGLKVDEKGYEGKTALMSAAGAGNIEAIDLLLKYKAKIDEKDENERTALAQMVQQGNVEIVRCLLMRGANPNVSNAGETVLGTAIERSSEENEEIVHLLLEHGADPNIVPEDSEPPLVLAAHEGNLAMVEHLLNKGARIDTSDNASETPLIAVLHSYRWQEARQMFYGQQGPLSEAGKEDILRKADANDLAIVQALSEHGLNVTEGANRFALLEAAEAGRAPITQFLIEKGALVEVTEAERSLFLQKVNLIREKATPQEIEEELAEYQTAEAYLRSDTPLLKAAKNGHAEIVKILLDKGANANANEARRKTALMYLAGAGRSTTVRRVILAWDSEALRLQDRIGIPGEPTNPTRRAMTKQQKNQWRQWAAEGDKSIAEGLIRKKANLNARDVQGRTALMEAASRSGPVLTELLLKAGAVVDTRDNLGRTALHQVVEAGRHRQILEWLKTERIDRDSSDDKVFLGKEKLAKNAKALKEFKANLLNEATFVDGAVIRALLSAGADVNARDRKGRTPLQIAWQTKQTSIAALLQKNGAR